MKPKFADITSWQQAELLMQPVFIRLIDNIRKQLEQAPWKGTYEDVQLWSEDVAPEIKARVVQLRQQLETALPKEAAAIQQALEQLPQPYPGYHLCLEHHNQQISIDLWDLCYQICFRNYCPPFDCYDDKAVEIDTNLIDETGEVDWQHVDAKAKQLVEQIFVNLPQSE
jgi:hypothetical protein